MSPRQRNALLAGAALVLAGLVLLVATRVSPPPGPPKRCSAEGEALFDTKRYEEAIVVLQKAIAAGCGEAVGFADLGWSLMAEGDRAGAVEALREAEKRDPTLKVHDDIEAMEEEAEEEGGDEGD